MIKNIATFALFAITTAVFSQNSNSSIYSFFGMGEQNNSKTVDQLNMGGVGVSFADNYHVNLSNPASLASLQFVSYGMGGANKNTFIKGNSGNDKSSSFLLSYLNLALPLGKGGGLSMGIKPSSTVEYSLKNTLHDTDNKIKEIDVFKGKGGTNNLFLGLGYKVHKTTSIGVQIDYMFGKTTKSITNQRAETSLASVYKSESNLRGFLFHLGLQNKLKINKKLHLHTGASLRFKNRLNDNKHDYFYSVSNTMPGDTVLNQSSVVKKNIPMKMSAGVGVGEDYKWFAGIDYTYRDKYDFTNISSKNLKVKYKTYNKIALGGFYIPKFNSVLSYWQRITYRAGLFYENTGLALRQNTQVANFEDINNFGMTFGIGLPTGNGLSNVNLGIELGRKGTTLNQLIREDYFIFRVGFSLNDKWFKKRKIY